MTSSPDSTNVDSSDDLDSFLNDVFNTDGSYQVDGQFPAIAGDRAKNCRFCPFKDRYDLCPKSERQTV